MTAPGGAGPMGGPFYHYNPNNPSPTKFPAYYDKTPFFHEWSRNFITEMRLDANGDVLKVNKLLADVTFRAPMHMTFGPNGSLYLVEWGSGGTGGGGGRDDSGIYRIDYVTSGNRAPVAKAAGTPTSGQAPLDGAVLRGRVSRPRRRRHQLRLGLHRRRQGGRHHAGSEPHLHRQRNLHGEADSDRPEGRQGNGDRLDQGGQHRADHPVRHATQRRPVRRGATRSDTG